MAVAQRFSILTAAGTSVIGVLVACAVFAALPLGVPWRVGALFSGSDLGYARGMRSASFLFVFTPIMVTILVWALRHRPFLWRRPFLSISLGAIAGYVAGVIAFPFLEALEPYWLAKLQNALRLDPIGFLVLPALCGSWLFGGLAALVVWVIRAVVHPRSSAASSHS
jgi:hypothetical protein